jgi:hypothetical protein
MIDARPGGYGAFELLKVETHLHTLHSDGQHSVAAMLEACSAAGYDAVALTDHNTTSGLGEARPVADSLGLILIEGVEVTTFHGHAVALGISGVPEWRDLDQPGAMNHLARAVHQAGGLVCVAHPTRLGSPLCSGCAWEWPLDPTLIDGWEVFSAPQPRAPHPEVALALWRQQLGAGARCMPLAAGDVHSVGAASAERPATYAYVAERTPQGVLDALRARRVFASRGTRLDFWLEAGQQTALAGSCVEAADWCARVAPEAGARIVEVATPGGRCLYAVLCGADGSLEAVSAPIWMLSSQRAETSV